MYHLIHFRVIILAIIFVCNSILAQESQEDSVVYGWKKEVIGNLNLTQASFENWQQGGESALAWQTNINSNFILNTVNYEWNNTAKFTLGFAKVGDIEARKSADEISLESVLTRKLSTVFNPFVAFTAKTQLLSGFQYDGDIKTQVSQFLDPGYFTQSAGIGYSPNEWVTTRFGVAVKETITSDFPIPYADDPVTPEIEKTKVEPGLTSVTDFKRELAENILFISKLDLFSDLEAIDRIDVLWENDIVMTVTKLINVTLEFDLLYDKDVSDERQIRQVLSVGLAYKLL